MLPSYDDLVKRFNEDLEILYGLVKSAKEVYNLQSEKQKKSFVEGFKKLIRTKNKLDTFTEFTFKDLKIDEQSYDDFIGAYLNIKESLGPTDSGPGGVSILDDIDFELELLQTDKINVDYILELLDTINITNNYEKEREKIVRMMENTVNLRSKIKLMEKFMDFELNHIRKENLNIKDEFDAFLQHERRQSICDLIDEEQLSEEITREILSEYEFSDKIDDELIKKSFDSTNLGYKAKRDKVKRIKEEILEIFDMFDF